MNTKEITKEQISALADGELADERVDVTLAALRLAERHSDWETYHQIGDVLRSDDMAVTLSSGFAARMAARLDAEPAIIAPAFSDRTADQEQAAPRAARHPAKRWAMPGMIAAAAAAAVAFITTPQLMVAMKSEPMNSSAHTVLVSAQPASSNASSSQPAVVSANVAEGVVLRDPRIDDYLLAHQRFSPSVYSTAQYARSATFATDSTK
jgi:sigma-E factor negative regulatory protein RseA